jgi:membrane-associated phospholipid phosphatase
MKLAAMPAQPLPALPPSDVDTSLVPGLALPHIPGLPGPDSPGTSYGKLLGPPAPDSLLGKADLAAVQAAQQLRTPAGDAWAVRMAKDGVAKIWFDLAAKHRAETGKVQGWLDTALLASTLAGNGAVTAIAKQHYSRQRPFLVDPNIKPPISKPIGSSYPSGHASSAFAAARVIAELAPDLATEAYSLATQVAVSRVYAGVHFPTDVVAGAMLGTAIGAAALRMSHRDLVAAVASLAPAPVEAAA